MKKIFWIFLDIDGVLNTKLEKGNYDFNSNCINIFNKIILLIRKQYTIKIVLSSDWRSHFSLEKIQYFFNDYDILEVPEYFTELYDNISVNIETLEEERLYFIEKFMNLYGIKDKYVIIDDMKLDQTLNKFFLDKLHKMIITNTDIGLTEDNLNDIQKLIINI